MSNGMIHKELIQIDLEVANTEEFFGEVCAKLESAGFIKNTFCEAIMLREKKFPTGLPTQPFAVAIPHTDPIHINKQFIAFTRLKNTIKWCEMATSDVWHEVKLVFMLGFEKETGHVELLQLLIEYFQDEEFMQALHECKTEDGCFSLLSNIKGL